MPNIPGIVEYASLPVWDSITLGASDVAATLFTTPIGQSSKTLYDTNMRDSGKVPNPDFFALKSIRFVTAPGATDANARALIAGNLTLTIGNKPYFEALLWELPGGCGGWFNPGQSPALTEATPNTFPAGVYYGSNGSPDPANILVLPIPIVIQPSEVFRVDLVWPVAPGALLLYVVLDGRLARPVQ